MLTVFTDGSCVRGNPGDAGSAYIVMRGKQFLEGLGLPIGRGTNNEGELTAAVCGLEACSRYAEKNEEVLLVSDSLYLLQGLPAADVFGADPVRPNCAIWRQLYDTMLKLHRNGNVLRTYWVRGHDSNAGNQLCDRLANSAAMRQMPMRPQELPQEARRQWKKTRTRV